METSDEAGDRILGRAGASIRTEHWARTTSGLTDHGAGVPLRFKMGAVPGVAGPRAGAVPGGGEQTPPT